MRRFVLLTLILLAGCVGRGDTLPSGLFTYPADLPHAYAEPPLRWADPGDLIYLKAMDRHRRVLKSGAIATRDPRTGAPVTRRLAGWVEVERHGGFSYFAPPSYLYAGAYKPTMRDGQLLIVPLPDVPADVPPPYACMPSDEYWRANLTWDTGRCRPGRPVEGVTIAYSADLRDWTEYAITLSGVTDGVAIFTHRRRAGWEGSKSSGITPMTPITESREFRSGVGIAAIPQGVKTWADVDIQVVRIEGQRVWYRLQQRDDCPAPCVQE